MQKYLFSSILLAGFHAQLQAQSTFATQALELPEMVVTATRTETPINQLSTAATVYTRKDIERLQVQTLPDLLKIAPGADLVQSGGMGTNSSLFLRGTNSDQVLVLIDGIKFGSATAGTSPFEFIPIDQVDRVEIIRGPQSSLYGSEAIGGVIQIFTRKGMQADKPTITLDVGGGSFATHREAGNISGKWHNSWYSVGASNIDSESFSARQEVPGPYGFFQPDHDGYNNTSVNAKVGHRFDNSAEIEAFFMHSEGKSAFDANYGGDNLKFINQVAGITGSMNILDNWRSTLRFGQSQDNNDNFYHDKSFDSRFNTSRWNASWLNEITLTEQHKLLLGGDYRVDEVSGSTDYSESSRYDGGIFGELRSQLFDHHFVTASLRWDTNQAFGDYVTGNVGWRYQWEHGISVLANFGNAFKSPSFNDLYYPNYGNANLRPEQSKSVETGILGQHDWGNWELRAYHTDIDNLIIPTMNPVTYDFRAENIGKAQIDGLEAEIGTHLFGWNAKLTGNLMHPENRETNKRLARRSEQKLNFDLSRSYGDFDVGTQVLAMGDRYDDAANKIKVGGFVTVDLRSAYHINKNWTINAKLSNLLDKNYQTVNTYNTADRNFFFSIHYTN